MKAVESQVNTNKEAVKITKEISKEHAKELEEKLQAELDVKKNLIAGVIETKGNAELEKKKVAVKSDEKKEPIKKTGSVVALKKEEKKDVKKTPATKTTEKKP